MTHPGQHGSSGRSLLKWLIFFPTTHNVTYQNTSKTEQIIYSAFMTTSVNTFLPGHSVGRYIYPKTGWDSLRTYKTEKVNYCLFAFSTKNKHTFTELTPRVAWSLRTKLSLVWPEQPAVLFEEQRSGERTFCYSSPMEPIWDEMAPFLIYQGAVTKILITQFRILIPPVPEDSPRVCGTFVQDFTTSGTFL